MPHASAARVLLAVMETAVSQSPILRRYITRGVPALVSEPLHEKSSQIAD
jgi:hypothetical protein